MTDLIKTGVAAGLGYWFGQRNCAEPPAAGPVAPYSLGKKVLPFTEYLENQPAESYVDRLQSLLIAGGGTREALWNKIIMYLEETGLSDYVPWEGALPTVGFSANSYCSEPPEPLRSEAVNTWWTRVFGNDKNTKGLQNGWVHPGGLNPLEAWLRDNSRESAFNKASKMFAVVDEVPDTVNNETMLKKPTLVTQQAELVTAFRRGGARPSSIPQSLGEMNLGLTDTQKGLYGGWCNLMQPAFEFNDLGAVVFMKVTDQVDHDWWSSDLGMDESKIYSLADVQAAGDDELFIGLYELCAFHVAVWELVTYALLFDTEVLSDEYYVGSGYYDATKPFVLGFRRAATFVRPKWVPPLPDNDPIVVNMAKFDRSVWSDKQLVHTICQRYVAVPDRQQFLPPVIQPDDYDGVVLSPERQTSSTFHYLMDSEDTLRSGKPGFKFMTSVIDRGHPLTVGVEGVQVSDRIVIEESVDARILLGPWEGEMDYSQYQLPDPMANEVPFSYVATAANCFELGNHVGLAQRLYDGGMVFEMSSGRDYAPGMVTAIDMAVWNI